MTIAELMDDVAALSHRSNIYTSGGVTLDTGSDDYADVLRWVKMAIRYVQDAGDWQAHKAAWTLTAATSPALTAGTYEYAMRTLKSDFRKIVADSVRYANQPLSWKSTIEELDRSITNGPSWKDSATANGTPRYATLMGNNLILAPKPSADFITTNATVYGYYYRKEAMTSTSATLLFSEGFYRFLVDVAMLYADRQEDQRGLTLALQMWRQEHLPLLRGYDETPASDESLEGADELVLGMDGAPGGTW